MSDVKKQRHVSSWRVTVSGKPGWAETINATSAGKAKSEYYLGLRDPWPDIPFTALRCRRIGQPQTSDDFLRCAANRGLPGARCGQRVYVGAAKGTIVGHNASANFEVLFDEDSHNYAGLRLSVHPDEIRFEQEELQPNDQQA